MSKMHLYPKREVPGQSFKGVKVYTVPNQSMSLEEIIKRFIRKEALPIEKEGVYDTRFGDLEKLERADITEKMEVAESIRQNLEKAEKREKSKKSTPKVEGGGEPPDQGPDPSGSVTGSPEGRQAPPPSAS